MVLGEEGFSVLLYAVDKLISLYGSHHINISTYQHINPQTLNPLNPQPNRNYSFSLIEMAWLSISSTLARPPGIDS